MFNFIVADEKKRETCFISQGNIRSTIYKLRFDSI